LYTHYFITIQRNVEKERKQLNCNYSDVHPKGTSCGAPQMCSIRPLSYTSVCEKAWSCAG